MDIVFEVLLLEAVVVALRLALQQLMEWWRARSADGTVPAAGTEVLAAA